LRLFLLEESDAARPPRPGDRVRLGADESHHLARVLRTPPGAPVRLADGHGRFVDGELVALRDGRAEVAVLAVRDDPRELRPPRLELACAVVKGARFDGGLEKAVELGAHAVRPLRTARAVVDPGEGRHARWAAVVRAAAKQSGRSLVPVVHPVADFAVGLAALAGARLFYGEEASREAVPGAGDAPGAALGVAQLIALGGGVATLAWLVGPEGGWSDGERAALAAAGARPVRLGPHVLRTETAVAAGLVLLQAAREAAAGAP
jgi:16S rRNA (uracil1498-N3)-methyltransferase